MTSVVKSTGWFSNDSGSIPSFHVASQKPLYLQFQEIWTFLAPIGNRHTNSDKMYFQPKYPYTQNKKLKIKGNNKINQI